MKRISMKTTFGLAAALLFTAACTHEMSDNLPNTSRAIDFQMPQTRAAVSDAADMADGFSVWGWYRNENSGPFNVFNGVKVSKSGNKWGYEGTQYWIPGMTYNFYGVYPADTGSCTSDGSITVEDFDCSKTGTGAVDLMTATATESGDAPESVEMKFGHELAKVNFIIKAEGTPVNIKVFKLEGVYYQGDLVQTANGTSSWDNCQACASDDNHFKLASSLSIVDGSEGDPLGNLLLVPHDNLTNARLHLTYRIGNEQDGTGSIDHVRNFELQTADITTWNAGQQYKYLITVQANDLRIEVTVNEWNEENTSVSWQ